MRLQEALITLWEGYSHIVTDSTTVLMRVSPAAPAWARTLRLPLDLFPQLPRRHRPIEQPGPTLKLSHRFENSTFDRKLPSG